MRKNLLGLLVLAPGLALAQTTYPYLIKGQVGRLSAPAKIYLLYGPQALDSAVLQHGRFELKGTIHMPSTATLVLEPKGKIRDGLRGKMFFQSPNRIQVFLEPGPVVVTSPDSLPNAHLTGGTLTADYQRLQASLQPVIKKLSTRDDTRTQEQAAAIMREYVQGEMAFVKANPNSWVSLEVLQQLRMLAPPQYAEMAPLYEAMSPTLRNSAPGRQYGELLAGLKAVAIGAQAPAFTQTTPDGKQVSLADYRGKYVLVDFWASWCGPCRAENPAVIKAYQAFKGRNFDVLGVSLDDQNTRDKWLKAIADDHLPWQQVSDLSGIMRSETAKRYGVQAIPQNFLIDPTGKIVAANLRADDLEATLARLVK